MQDGVRVAKLFDAIIIAMLFDHIMLSDHHSGQLHAYSAAARLTSRHASKSKCDVALL